MKFAILLPLFFIALGCTQQSEETSFEYITLEPKEKLSYDSDEYFLTNLRHMDYSENTYVLVEYEYNRITLLNKDHTLKVTITAESNELTDLNNPVSANASKNEFAIFNDGNNRVNFYNYDGEFQSSVLLKSATSDMIVGFSIKNNAIYHSIGNGISPFAKMNTQTNKVENIGQFHPSLTSDWAKLYKSFGQIYELDDQRFVTILSTMGEVVLYNADSEILSKFNINEMDVFKTTANLLEEANLNGPSNSARAVFMDSKLIGDKLFILAFKDDEPLDQNKRNYTLNHIIQLKIGTDNTFKIERLYQLNGAKYFNTFAISDDNTLTVSDPVVNQLWTYQLK